MISEHSGERSLYQLTLELQISHLDVDMADRHYKMLCWDSVTHLGQRV